MNPREEPPRRRETLEVDPAEGGRALQLLAYPDAAHPARDSNLALHRAGEAEGFVERLQPVRELELVALGAAEELDPRRALGRGDFDRIERVHGAGREPADARVERDPVDVHPALEREVVVERDRPAVDLQRDDPRYVQRSERSRGRVIEPPPRRRR